MCIDKCGPAVYVPDTSSSETSENDVALWIIYAGTFREKLIGFPSARDYSTVANSFATFWKRMIRKEGASTVKLELFHYASALREIIK